MLPTNSVIVITHPTDAPFSQTPPPETSTMSSSAPTLAPSYSDPGTVPPTGQNVRSTADEHPLSHTESSAVWTHTYTTIVISVFVVCILLLFIVVYRHRHRRSDLVFNFMEKSSTAKDGDALASRSSRTPSNWTRNGWGEHSDIELTPMDLAPDGARRRLVLSSDTPASSEASLASVNSNLSGRSPNRCYSSLPWEAPETGSVDEADDDVVIQRTRLVSTNIDDMLDPVYDTTARGVATVSSPGHQLGIVYSAPGEQIPDDIIQPTVSRRSAVRSVQEHDKDLYVAPTVVAEHKQLSTAHAILRRKLNEGVISQSEFDLIVGRTLVGLRTSHV